MRRAVVRVVYGAALAVVILGVMGYLPRSVQMVALATAVIVAIAANERARAAERFTQLFEASPLPQSMSRFSDHRLIAVNPAYLRLFGVRREDAIGKRASDLGITVPAELRDSLIAELRAGGSVDAVPVVAESRAGRREVLLSTRLIDLDDELVALSSFADGSGQREAERHASEAEQRSELERQVRQTQKLESVGLLAGGIAHDFNNVLAVISANVELLHDDVGDPALRRELVEEIRLGVGRGTSLTRQLLAFSRKQTVEPVVLDVNVAIKDTRKMLRRMVGEDIVIQTSLDADLPPVKIDPGYLVQVLMNLAVNARDAMPHGGELSISTRFDARRREVLIDVTDSGTGMPPEICARVFEPFFTTKEVGKGTGLGLSVVHGIVEQAGGSIEVRSEEGAGTTFLIYLPASDQPVQHLQDVSRLAPIGSERILLVDDDPFVRKASARALRSRGYAVLEAACGDEALARIGEHDDIRMLVTDVVMPGMDGAQLAQLARESRPDLRVLFTSGYIDDALTHHGIQSGGDSFLEKPFGPHELAGRVRALLDAA